MLACKQGVLISRVLYEVADFRVGGGWKRVSVDSYSASVKCMKHFYKNYAENKNGDRRKQRKYINNVIINSESKNS